MARYKVVLAYDGTDFSGFQRQVGTSTIQGVVEKSLEFLGWQGESILASGRTDSGVHALGQVIAFDLDWAHTEEDLSNALNANLPPSVAVRSTESVNDTFHPRLDARSRRYRYRILEDPVRSPLEERYAWRVWPQVDLDRVKPCTSVILGRHDFRAFGSPMHRDGTTIRNVFRVEWRKTFEGIQFEIVANAFLYHMVRRIVFVLVQVGMGNHQAEEIQTMMEAGDPNRITGLAPANGLCLMEVRYDQDAS